jgi:FAD/FMN-containing dehydrogenase
MAVDAGGIASAVGEELESGLRGEVVWPGDRGHDTARAVFNGMVDRRPLAVIRPVDASDVVRCITFVRRHDLPLSVRGGGHSVAGNAVRDGAVMLDLSGMKGLRVDPETRTVRAESGLTLGEFDRATQAFGLATTLGVVSTTGIAGLTLGGGLGWLNGRYGLACDNLISADVATADGRLLRASAQENEDLFWSIRGGGNCGPIDEGEQVLHPLRTFQSPVDDGIQPMPYTVLQSARGEGFPSGRLHYWKSGWLRDVTGDAIETLMRFVPQMPSSASGVGLQQLHGVASRVAPSATAFPHRAEHYDFPILSQWSEATDSDRNVQWTRALFEAMRPHLEESVYVNNLGDEGPGRVQAAYGENYPRLVAVKRAYDPDNLFRANQNIDPSTDIASG